MIADAFSRIGHLELPESLNVAASPEDGYRMRARLHVRGYRPGFFREGSHELCDARLTRQLLPATCDTLDRLTGVMRSLGLEAIREIELAENMDASDRVVFISTRPDARMARRSSVWPPRGSLGSSAAARTGRPRHRRPVQADVHVALRRHVLALPGTVD